MADEPVPIPEGRRPDIDVPPLSVRGTPMTSAIRRGIVWMIAVAGVAAGFLAIRGTNLEELDLSVSVPRTALAGVVYAVGMCVYAHSWAAFFDADRRNLALRFLVSQPAKYVPGGVFQPLGQVAATADLTDSPVKAVSAFPVHAFTNVASAGTLAAIASLWSALSGPVRFLMILGLVAPVFISRRVLILGFGLVGKLLRRDFDEENLPGQSHVRRAYVLGVVAHATMASAFVVLVGDVGVPAPLLVGVYAAAWLVGYVAVPFPAGVGAREAMLVILLSPILAASGVVSLTVIHRIMTVIVELVLMAGAMILLGQYRIARFK